MSTPARQLNGQWAEMFEQIVASRRSVRAFQPNPVPRDTILKIFEIAQKAPSNCNTQPWRAAVVSGNIRDELAEEFVSRAARRDLSPDLPFSGKYDGVYQQRQIEAAICRYAAIGVERSDASSRGKADLENFRFHGAPHAVFLFLPPWAKEREASDLGQYAQTLMLAMAAHGLGSCPQTALGFFPDVVRSRLKIQPDLILLFGISFGYEDKTGPQSNPHYRTTRAPVSECVEFFD